MKKSLFSVWLLLGLSTFCFAQQKPFFDIYAGLGISTLSSNVSNDFPSLESSTQFGGAIGGSVYFDLFFINLELGAFGIEDREGFSQFTTQRVQESTTTGFFATPGFGLHVGNDQFFGSVNLGYTFAGANRSIENCVDCDSESISLDDGPSIRPKFGVFVTDTVFLSLSYEQYFNDHLGSLVLFGFGGRLGK